MNRLILCEGKTDAILLSYYLEHTCNWRHCKAPVTLNIKADETRGESAYWYQKDTEKLLICGVGGKDNFYRFFREKILSAMIDSSAFSKIAIVTDRDNQVEASICASFESVCSPVITNITVNTWVSNAYQNSFGQDIEVNFLLVIVPKDKEGALETLLLDAISEDVNDKIIVEKSKAYIQNIEPFAKKYMSKTRLKLKACLGVTWAIQYPEKIFSFIDEQIRTVKWEESQSLHECFEQLKKI